MFSNDLKNLDTISFESLSPDSCRRTGKERLVQRSGCYQAHRSTPRSGARALTSQATINLPSTASLPHLAFNVKTYIFVGSGLSRALLI